MGSVVGSVILVRHIFEHLIYLQPSITVVSLLGDVRKHNTLFFENNPTEPNFGYKKSQKEEKQAGQAKNPGTRRCCKMSDD